jgi:hypothetical protein
MQKIQGIAVVASWRSFLVRRKGRGFPSTRGPSESKEKVAVPEVTGSAANRLREHKILSIYISIKLGSPESGNKIAPF